MKDYSEQDLAELLWKAYNAGWSRGVHGSAAPSSLFYGWKQWRRKHDIAETGWEQRNSLEFQSHAQPNGYRTSAALRRLAANGFGRFIR